MRGIVQRLPRPLRELAKFGIVGTVGFAVDFSVYTFLTRLAGWQTVVCLGLDGSYAVTDLEHIRSCLPHYPIVAANMLSVLVAVTSNFLLNKFWTFRDPRAGVLAMQGAAYLLMSTLTWTLNQVVTGLFASRLDILHVLFPKAVDLVAKILAVGVVLFVNFGGSKFLIFRRSGRSLRTVEAGNRS